MAEPTGNRSVSVTRHERVRNSRSVPPTGCLQGGAAAPRKILAGGRLEAVVCHAGSQAAGMASAAYPTNSTTAKRLRSSHDLKPTAFGRYCSRPRDPGRQKVLFRGTETGRWCPLTLEAPQGSISQPREKVWIWWRKYPLVLFFSFLTHSRAHGLRQALNDARRGAL